jgi:hypothetical protein
MHFPTPARVPVMFDFFGRDRPFAAMMFVADRATANLPKIRGLGVPLRAMLHGIFQPYPIHKTIIAHASAAIFTPEEGSYCQRIAVGP